MKRAAPLLAVALLGGCAYFNGIYNARQAERRADKLAARGRDGEAAGLYGTAAIKAETVLVRHAKSGWAHDALYLAGRGWAFSNQCERALPRLDAYLALPGQPAARRNRAALAIGMCNVRLGHHEVARDMLRPLLASRDHELTSAAAIWAARASIGVGETDSALAYLRSAGVAAAEWELATAYLGQRRHASAESLLVSRAQRGDFRREVLDAIGTLWAAGREKGVLRLTSAYDASRLRQVDRARLHLLVGDLLYGAGRDSAARQHFALSQRSGRDSLPGREASARLSELALRGLSSLPDVEAVIARTRDAAAGTALQRRLDENVVFVKILETRTDYTGSSLFLAGEVARDSLRAFGYAHSVFKRLVASLPNVPVAPKALLAAAALAPDSAPVYYARLREEYRSSPITMALDGRDNPLIAPVSNADLLLQQAWAAASKSFADSLNARRRARDQSAAVAASGGVPPPTPPPIPPPSPR